MEHVLLLNMHQKLSDKTKPEFYKTRYIMIHGFDIDLINFVFLVYFKIHFVVIQEKYIFTFNQVLLHFIYFSSLSSFSFLFL